MPERGIVYEQAYYRCLPMKDRKMTHLVLVKAPEDCSATVGKSRVEFANSLRGIACLCVVFAHYAGVFWEAPAAVATLTGMPDYEVPPARMPVINWLDNAIPNLQWGPLGVAIFFLISGFVIPFSVARQNAGQFLLNRTLRIWPTYLCGFAFTAGLIAIGAYSYGAPAPFATWEALVHAVPGLRDLVGSRNIDGIIWTLEIEIKFYVICALTVPWLRTSSMKVFSVPMLIGIAALILSWQLPNMSPTAARLSTTAINAAQYLIYMYIGVAFHFLHQGHSQTRQLVTWMGTLSLMMCLVWSSSPYKVTFPSAWNYGLAICIFGWAMSYPQFLRSNKLLDAVAAISYPLYVVHGVAGYVILRWLYAAEVPAWASILLTTAITFAVATALHVLVEKPSQRVGKRLAEKLPRGRSWPEQQAA